MSFAKHLKCRECGREYPLDPIHVCEFCFGPLEVVYDYEAIGPHVSRERIERGPPTIWRYADLLPCDGEPPSTSAPASRRWSGRRTWASALGLEHLYIKNDCANPTWSFKDRVVSVAASEAREFGFDTLACASTGNLANSVAAHAARAGMEAFVFIPADLEPGKILGSAVYGADARRRRRHLRRRQPPLQRARRQVPVGVRQHQRAPLLRRGQQDARLRGRRAARLARARPLHRADGLRLALREDLEGPPGAGEARADRRRHTRMSGAQARGCSPIADGLGPAARFNIRPAQPNTIAKSLAIGNPADGYYALKMMAETGGAGAAVDRRRDRRGHQAARRDRGHLRRDGRRRRHRRPAAARRPGPACARTRSSSPSSPAPA